MAVSLNGSRRGGRRHLICAVCQEVYRSPRLLPCHHSFCLQCIEGLARARGGRNFNCPSCRRPTAVPPAGAAGFQTNFHIDEDDLELAQRDPNTTMCSVHDVEPLVFFCVQCDQAICIRCKLTKHDHHETQDLSEAAARCQDQLQSAKDRLESAVSFLTKKSEEAHDNLKAAREKGKLLEEQVKIQHDTLVTKVGTWRDSVLEEIKQSNNEVDQKLSTDAHKIQQELDSIVQLQQRVQHALGDASDAEKVQVEKEMREGQGSAEKLDQAKNRVPEATARPGLHYDVHSVSDDDIRRFLGSPVELSLPCGPVSEVVVPIYQCGQEGACREVHNVCYVTDQMICVSFGGCLPDYTGECQFEISEEGKTTDCQPTEISYRDKKVCFSKYGKDSYFYSSYEKPHYITYAKSGVLMDVALTTSKTCKIKSTSVVSENPFKTKKTTVLRVQSTKPVAFDATKDEKLFVIIEENSNKDTGRKEWNVLLFRRPKGEAFTSYKPADKGFLPTDVCFWQEDGRHKLLVADAQNDSVHVVNVEGDACHFERYLAAGNSHLVRPTALNVDDRNRVWIGCGNGWILRCEKRTETDEPPCDNEVEAITSGGSSQSSVAGDYRNRRSPGGAILVPSTSGQALLTSHASQHVFGFLSPSRVSIRSPPSPTPSHASVSSVATELSIRSTDTLSFLSE